MKRIVIAVGVVLVLAAAGFGLWRVSMRSADDVWLGYVEAESTHVAAPVSGTLSRLDVVRGGSVVAGAPLFGLDPQTSDAESARLAAAVSAAKAQRDDLLKARQRPAEIAIIRARQAEARAALVNARAAYNRATELNRRGFATNAQVDVTRAALKSAQGLLDATQAEESAARLSGRNDVVRAAEAAITEAEAALAQARRRSVEIAPVAHAAAQVEQTYFVPGEWVPANTPIVSLIEPGRVKLRFFVPQDSVASLHPGTRVRVRCDGCGPQFGATVRFIAPRAEFTPPVIYSERARGKLVFLIEATPDGDPARLHPGLPVEVRAVEVRAVGMRTADVRAAEVRAGEVRAEP